MSHFLRDVWCKKLRHLKRVGRNKMEVDNDQGWDLYANKNNEICILIYKKIHTKTKITKNKYLLK